MILEDASGEKRPRAPKEGELTLVNIPGKADLVDLRDIFMLAYWKPVSVDLWIGTMYPPSVGFQGFGFHIQP